MIAGVPAPVKRIQPHQGVIDRGCATAVAQAGLSQPRALVGPMLGYVAVTGARLRALNSAK